MKEYYKYYVAVHLEDKSYLGNMTQIGWWNNFTIYEIEDHAISRLDLLRVRTVNLPKKIAYGWKFCDVQRDYIRVDANNTPFIEQIGGVDKLEPHKAGKYTYYLTEEDKEVGVAFGKIMLKELLHRSYRNMWLYTKNNFSDMYLEYFSYVYQTDDKNFISTTENNFSKLTEDYKQYYKKLGILVENMSKLESMIENISTIPEFHAAFYQITVDLNSFPEKIRTNETIKNV
jgi:hypothetical protein